MKKLLFVLALLVGGSASAQESYSLSASAGQVSQHDRDRSSKNRQTCTRLGQSLTCTQAQACTAAGAAGGASCTAAQARAANARIYPATLAGREEFLTFDMVVPEFQRRVKGAAADESNAAKAWFLAQNQTVRDAECSKWGVLPGCNPYE
jgi:hypothetical protein